MSIVVVGMSHRSAPVTVLEQMSMEPEQAISAMQQMVAGNSLSEAIVLSTCNRVEVYAVTNSFHAGIAEIVGVLHQVCQVDEELLRRHLYVRYADAAAEHVLRVTSGLDSMVVGEQQIIGQVRDAYTRAKEAETVGTILHGLVQRALHAGKRVHTETEIDEAGASMVSFAVDEAIRRMGRSDLSGCRVLILGAGVMASLSATYVGKKGASHLVIANRTRSRAEVLAAHAREAGVSASVVEFAERAARLSEVDLVISATGANTLTLTAADMPQRGPLMLVDVSMPRDIDDAVAVGDIQLVNIERLHAEHRDYDHAVTSRAEAIVATELEEFSSQQRVRDVIPAVTALRQHAAEIVSGELERLDQRTATMAATDREAVHRTVRRVVDKLLHTPTVRIKELAAQSGTVNYESALYELFGLAPAASPAVSLNLTELPAEYARVDSVAALGELGTHHLPEAAAK